MEKGIPGALVKINRRINELFVNLQVVFIVLSAMLVALDVLLRWIFSTPISGTSEYIGFMMIIASYCGLGVCTMERSHLKVDLVVQLLPKKVQEILDIVNSILVIAVGSVMLYAGFTQGMRNMKLNTKGTFTGVPYWPFYLIMALCYFPVVLGSVINIIEDVYALLGKKTEKTLDKEGSKE